MGHTNLDGAQTAQAKQTILDLRRQAYSAEHCARAVGIARRTLYDWTEADPVFAQAWQDANESRLDWHEDVLRTCAEKGQFIPSLAVLKSAGRIVEKTGPDGAELARSFLAEVRALASAQRRQIAAPLVDTAPTADVLTADSADSQTPDRTA